MDVRALRYFTEVVRQQSFTRAAQKLFVTQPTISKMLRQLEEELGCTLILRDGRRLHLTDSGGRSISAARRSCRSFISWKRRLVTSTSSKPVSCDWVFRRWSVCRSPVRFPRFAAAIPV